MYNFETFVFSDGFEADILEEEFSYHPVMMSILQDYSGYFYPFLHLVCLIMKHS